MTTLIRTMPDFKSPHRLFGGILFFVVFILCLFKISNPDLGFHLVTGRYVIEQARVPDQDFSTFTRFGFNDYPHSALPAALFYAIYTAGGFELLVLMKAVLFAFSFTLVFLAAVNFWKIQSSLGLGLLTIVSAIASIFCRDRLDLQPYVFTDLCLAGLIYVLSTLNNDLFRKRFLLFIAAIFLIWFNAHLGVVHGLLLMGVYLISLIITKRKEEARFFLKVYIPLVLLIGLLSAWVNPSSLNIWIHLWIEASNSLKQSHIGEYQPGIHHYPAILFFLGCVFVVTVYINFKRKRVQTFPVLVFILFFFLTCAYQREIGHLSMAWIFLSGAIAGFLPVVKNARFFVATILGSFLVLLLHIEIQHPLFEFGMGLNSRAIPEKSLERVRQVYQPKQLYNTATLGGWWSFFHQEPNRQLSLDRKDRGKIFHDGRGPLYPSLYFAEKVLPLLRGDPKGLKILDEYGVDFVLLSVFDPLKHILRRHLSEWRLVYFDEAVILFQRRSNNQPVLWSQIDAWEFDHRLWQIWPTFESEKKQRFREEVDALYENHPRNARALFLQGLILLQDNKKAEALKKFYESGEAGDQHNNAFGNAAKLACDARQYELADFLYARATQRMIAQDSHWREWQACLRHQGRDFRAWVEGMRGTVYQAYFRLRG